MSPGRCKETVAEMLPVEITIDCGGFDRTNCFHLIVKASSVLLHSDEYGNPDNMAALNVTLHIEL